jgi:hypothetical protein
MINEKSRKQIDKYFDDMLKDRNLEKERFGYIGTKEIYGLDIYSRNHERDIPHLMVTLMLEKGQTPVAKIALPPPEDEENPIGELIILWEKTGFSLHPQIKRRIREWLSKPYNNGSITNLECMWISWDGQAASFSKNPRIYNKKIPGRGITDKLDKKNNQSV